MNLIKKILVTTLILALSEVRHESQILLMLIIEFFIGIFQCFISN